MKKQTLAGIIVVVIIVIAGLAYWYSSMQAPAPLTSATTPTTAVTSTPIGAVSSTTSVSSTASNSTDIVPQTPAPQSFTVNGNDSTADLLTITVKKGTPVTITFGTDVQGTYHGGLDFRSSVVSTGPIAPGSTKTVTFTAEDSFAFTPYWPASNIKKPYVINVVVQ